jgi:hypothetical protein
LEALNRFSGNHFRKSNERQTLGAPGAVHPGSLVVGTRGSTGPTCQPNPSRTQGWPAISRRRRDHRQRGHHQRTPLDIYTQSPRKWRRGSTNARPTAVMALRLRVRRRRGRGSAHQNPNRRHLHRKPLLWLLAIPKHANRKERGSRGGAVHGEAMRGCFGDQNRDGENTWLSFSMAQSTSMAGAWGRAGCNGAVGARTYGEVEHRRRIPPAELRWRIPPAESELTRSVFFFEMEREEGTEWRVEREAAGAVQTALRRGRRGWCATAPCYRWAATTRQPRAVVRRERASAGTGAGRASIGSWAGTEARLILFLFQFLFSKNTKQR